jgi:hypothetical protein
MPVQQPFARLPGGRGARAEERQPPGPHLGRLEAGEGVELARCWAEAGLTEQQAAKKQRPERSSEEELTVNSEQ